MMNTAAATTTTTTAPSTSSSSAMMNSRRCVICRCTRVLSIQSHTVRGHVGNKSACLPLQVLGYEVDNINSVQLSNHTGYPYYAGQILSGSDLDTLIDGLERNGLLEDYSHILTGYIGSLSFLESIASAVKKVIDSKRKEMKDEKKSESNDVCYVCDPVLGDEGKLYVPEELVQAYKEKIIPLAGIITPNQFEVEKLLNVTITTEEEAWAACAEFHSCGPHTVIITSLSLPAEKDDIILLCSTALPQENNRPSKFRIRLSKIDMYFVGAGDLLAALLLARTAEFPGDICRAVELSVASLQHVLKRTKIATDKIGISHLSQAASFSARELRLVQSMDDIKDPTVEVYAEHVQSSD